MYRVFLVSIAFFVGLVQFGRGKTTLDVLRFIPLESSLRCVQSNDNFTAGGYLLELLDRSVRWATCHIPPLLSIETRNAGAVGGQQLVASEKRSTTESLPPSRDTLKSGNPATSRGVISNGSSPNIYFRAFFTVLESPLASVRNSSLRHGMTLRRAEAVLELPEEASRIDPPLSRLQCADKYGDRQFLSDNNARAQRSPALLYTFPGSGNTWSRLLIEYATGVLTGSVYGDDQLINYLPGEYTCNKRVSAVKAHPQYNPARDTFWIGDSDRTEPTSDDHSSLIYRTGKPVPEGPPCNCQGVDGVAHFERAVAIFRNPYDAVWSQFEYENHGRSHVQGVPRAGFDWMHWEFRAMEWALAFYITWEREYPYMDAMLGPDRTLYASYESLKNDSSRVETLGRISAFIGVSLPPRQVSSALSGTESEIKTISGGSSANSSSSDGSSSSSSSSTEERLACSFQLAESEGVHRRADAPKFMTKAEAYDDRGSSALVCGMWQLFGQHARRLGYSEPWGGADCSAYSCSAPGQRLLSNHAAGNHVNSQRDFLPILSGTSGNGGGSGGRGVEFVGWRYAADDSDVGPLYGWLLETDAQQVARICSPDLAAAQQQVVMCGELTERTKLSFRVEFGASPVLQISYLQDPHPSRGRIKVWLGSARDISSGGDGDRRPIAPTSISSSDAPSDDEGLHAAKVTISSRGYRAYEDFALPKTATIVTQERPLGGRSSVINEELHVLPGMTPGVHTVHIAMAQMKGGATSYKFKLLGVASC